ncbi:hypothetical protein ACFPN7_46985 [Amycolatopsis halotolerans]|uniref:hypothetical protein n=1 Tax=Amycolatopsis halotolerans TaxID=330083 RepID=UPI00360CEB5A
MHRRRGILLAAAAVAGTAIAVTMGLTSSSEQPTPVAASAPSSASPSPVAASPAPAAASPTPAAVSPTPAPPAVKPASAHPTRHSNPAPKPTHSASTGRAPSDAIRDRVYEPPLNPRPQGQVPGAGWEPGTKSGNTGPSDEPVTTPTPLPNPGTH